MTAQDERLSAIAAAAAGVLRQTPYHSVRAADVAAAVRLPKQAGRSAVWLYNEVHNRRVLVALAAAHAWRDFAARANWSPQVPPRSVTAARSAAVAALGLVVAFHRTEQALMTQVGYGIGDISTAEKRQLAADGGLIPPDWPDSEWGRIAAAAWDGRCEVFTEFLRPVLRGCAESVTYLDEPTVTESASRLSDVAFRTCLADRDGPADLVARGLAALWFERDLTRLAGSLPRDLESGETALAAVARRRADARAEASASSVVVRILLEAGTLHERCVIEARRTVSAWQSLTADPDATTGHDLQRLSDAAGHLGLAAVRYGDRRTAATAWELSRQVAATALRDDQSRIARADTNLAGLAAETGRAAEAARLIAAAAASRVDLRDRHPDDPAAWRRLTVTERVRADVARLAGQATESVRLATSLLADRRDQLGDLAHPDTAEAQAVLAQALLSAGQPTTARRYLEEAADVRRSRYLASSYRIQEELVWLAKAALVLEHPRTVVDLLTDQTGATDWFRDRVSFRLSYTARRLLAVARGELGQTDEATATLLATREQLAAAGTENGLDPLAADLDRSLGELALRRGDAATAASSLARLADAEAEGGTPRPAHGWTLVLLARAASQLGEAEHATDCFRAVTALAGAGVDPAHPVILTARYDEAVRSAARGATGRATELLAPVLDRTVLGHGRPALGEAHPLLARARAFAERLGVAFPGVSSAFGGVSLDIDS